MGKKAKLHRAKVKKRNEFIKSKVSEYNNKAIAERNRITNEELTAYKTDNLLKEYEELIKEGKILRKDKKEFYDKIKKECLIGNYDMWYYRFFKYPEVVEVIKDVYVEFYSIEDIEALEEKTRRVYKLDSNESLEDTTVV